MLALWCLRRLYIHYLQAAAVRVSDTVFTMSSLRHTVLAALPHPKLDSTLGCFFIGTPCYTAQQRLPHARLRPAVAVASM